ncbi:MAG: chain length determinant protein tyrosine kinase EpsG [Rhizobacter sp.]
MNASITNFKPAWTMPTRAEHASIGEILVASGRLDATDANRIVERQKKDQSRFGDAALALKLLRKDDIDYALSQQFGYAYLSVKDSTLSHELVAAYKPFGRTGENLRALRSQLMLRWLNPQTQRKSLAVVSASRGEGRSFIAANLAIVFAQQGERVLLIDGDLRNGRQNALFNWGTTAGLSELLVGRTTLGEAALRVAGLPGLAVLPAGALPPNPQELLGRPAFLALLNEASLIFDVIILDTPAAEHFADAEIIVARAGAAMVVARRHVSTMQKTATLTSRLQESAMATLVGAVLNEA